MGVSLDSQAGTNAQPVAVVPLRAVRAPGVPIRLEAKAKIAEEIDVFEGIGLCRRGGTGGRDRQEARVNEQNRERRQQAHRPAHF